jgi:hypothetical protein
MAYFVNTINIFLLRVNYPVLVFEKRRQKTAGDVAVFID